MCLETFMTFVDLCVCFLFLCCPSAETRVEAIRSWNEQVRAWHRTISKRIF